MNAPPSDNTYVQDLPIGCDSDFVTKMFGAYGATVAQCKVLTEKAKDGCVHALVRFGSVDEASQVVDKLSGQILEGLERPIRITFAVASPSPGGSGGDWGKWSGGGKSAAKGSAPYESGKATNKNFAPAGPGSLYVSGLPAECEKDMLMTVFSEFGTILRATMLRTSHANGKRAALVEYSTGEEAQQIISTFSGQVLPGLVEPVTIEMNYSAPGVQGPATKAVKSGWKGDWKGAEKGGAPEKGAAKGARVLNPDDSIKAIVAGLEASGAMPGGVPGKWANADEKSLFVSGLPVDTTDGDLYRIFSPFGAIMPAGVKAMLHGDGSCKGIAFISYLEEIGAQNAIAVLNGCQLPNGDLLSVKIKGSTDESGKGKGDGKGKSAAEGGKESSKGSWGGGGSWGKSW